MIKLLPAKEKRPSEMYNTSFNSIIISMKNEYFINIFHEINIEGKE